MFAIAHIQLEHSREEASCLLHSQPAHVLLVVCSENRIDVLDALCHIGLLKCLQTVFVVVKNDGKEDTHQEPDAKEDENDEKDGVGSIDRRNFEHYVREILSRQAHEHIPESLRQRTPLSDALGCALE